MSSNQLVEVFEGLTEEGLIVYRCRGRSAPDLPGLATKLGIPFDRLCPRPDPEPRAKPAFTADPVTFFTFLTNPLILLFAAGVSIAAMLEPAIANGTSLRFAGPVALALTVAGIVLFMAAVNHEPWPLGWQTVFWGLAAAVVVLGVLAGDECRCGLRWMEKLGDASYSIYLFHFIAIAAFGRAWSVLFGGIEPTQFVLLAIVVAAISGWIIHKTIERPMLDKFRQLGAPRTHMSGAVLRRS